MKQHVSFQVVALILVHSIVETKSSFVGENHPFQTDSSSPYHYFVLPDLGTPTALFSCGYKYTCTRTNRKPCRSTISRQMLQHKRFETTALHYTNLNQEEKEIQSYTSHWILTWFEKNSPFWEFPTPSPMDQNSMQKVRTRDYYYILPNNTLTFLNS